MDESVFEWKQQYVPITITNVNCRWEWPDRNPFPQLTFYPRVEKAVRRYEFWCQRARDAWSVLKDGLPPEDYY